MKYEDLRKLENSKDVTSIIHLPSIMKLNNAFINAAQEQVSNVKKESPMMDKLRNWAIPIQSRFDIPKEYYISLIVGGQCSNGSIDCRLSTIRKKFVQAGILKSYAKQLGRKLRLRSKVQGISADENYALCNKILEDKNYSGILLNDGLLLQRLQRCILPSQSIWESLGLLYIVRRNNIGYFLDGCRLKDFSRKLKKNSQGEELDAPLYVMFIDGDDTETLLSARSLALRKAKKYRVVLAPINLLQPIINECDTNPFLTAERLALLGHCSRGRDLCFSTESIFTLLRSLKCQRIHFVGCWTSDASLLDRQTFFDQQFARASNDHTSLKEFIATKKIRYASNIKNARDHLQSPLDLDEKYPMDYVQRHYNYNFKHKSNEARAIYESTTIPSFVKSEFNISRTIGRRFDHDLSHTFYTGLKGEFVGTVAECALEKLVLVCIRNKYRIYAKGYTNQCNIHPLSGKPYNTTEYLFNSIKDFDTKTINKLQTKYYNENMKWNEKGISYAKTRTMMTFKAVGYKYEPLMNTFESSSHSIDQGEKNKIPVCPDCGYVNEDCDCICEYGDCDDF